MSPGWISLWRPGTAPGAGRSVSCKVPSASKPTHTSAQSTFCRWNWRIGSASKNSFANKNSGASAGICSTLSTHFASGTRDACARRNTSDASTNTTCAASTKPGTARPTRNTSAIKVPRPGPSSARMKRDGRPCSIQACAMDRPSISPNIWLISGAVVKSPAAPRGSRVV